MGRPGCLALMPMFPEYGDVRRVVAESIATAGAEMHRLEEALPDPEWQWWLIQEIERADFVLADLTDHNPFVAYELGLAHSRRLPALLIVNARNDAITATVKGTPFLAYDDDALGTFGEELTSELTAIIAALAAPVPNGLPTVADLIDAYRAGCARLEVARAAGVEVQPVASDEFRTLMAVAWARGDRVAPWNEAAGELSLLARLVADADRIEVMAALRRWAEDRTSPQRKSA
jgi:hypothetical protein